MRRLLPLWALALVPASALPDASAADKTSLGCIQASDAGQTARDQGSLLRARELFAQCAEPKCPAMIRRDCTSWVEQVQQQIPSIVLGARDADGRDVLDANVTIDGVAADRKTLGGPIELNPGAHVIRWESTGDGVEMRIALRAQEKNRAVVATFTHSASPTEPAAKLVPPAPSADVDKTTPSKGLPTATYVLGGVGVAALGAFAYFGLRARHDSTSMHDTCAPACAHDDVTALKTKLVVADVALGIGALSVAGAVFFALRASSAAPKSAWDVRVTPAPGGARAELGMKF